MQVDAFVMMQWEVQDLVGHAMHALSGWDGETSTAHQTCNMTTSLAIGKSAVVPPINNTLQAAVSVW